MKFHRASTTAPLKLRSIFGEGGRVFPVGTEVSATDVGRADLWHLNAEHDGETYDGYAPSEALEICEVIATVNE